ncbi:MAG: tRNA (adenosine(37)-N6)-threonylcarbamoyltransferase complex dimerization subunit type 1 TsaB [Bacteroidetes bacterium]|nr:tRNA (adenosine(37)-N6)-threonylcarbamoyltransferase complex dimerization subunit type 1 TsaB [Bacteroidota bacterium]
MSLILNIDCSTEKAIVAVAENGKVLQEVSNQQQKEHASFLHIAIEDVIKKTGATLHTIDAVAVANGPGSYTGLRVAMASAKGLSYALSKPFIALGTLDIMAVAAVLETGNESNVLYCPMIDARRMEVFTALYDERMDKVVPEQALILNENSFNDYLQKTKIYFSGNGSEKFRGIVLSKNAAFITGENSMQAMSILSHKKFSANSFSDLLYAEPLYVKEFHSSPDNSGKIINY